MALITLVAILSLYPGHKLQMGTAGRDFHVGLLIAVGLFAKPAADLLSEQLSRRHVPGPGLLWPCLVALALTIFDAGLPLTILAATVFDAVGCKVALTGLGSVACVGFPMAVLSPIIADDLYETLGFAATVYYIGVLFVATALVFAALPLSWTAEEPSTG